MNQLIVGHSGLSARWHSANWSKGTRRNGKRESSTKGKEKSKVARILELAAMKPFIII